MRRVFIVSPLSSPTPEGVHANLAFARRCAIHCLAKGESPFAGHLFFPQFLDDDVPQDRDLGMRAAYEWMAQAETVVAYIDRGFSKGMLADLAVAAGHGDSKVRVRTEFRRLDGASVPNLEYLHEQKIPHYPPKECSFCRSNVDYDKFVRT